MAEEDQARNVPRLGINLQAPKPFDGTPTNWSKWRQRFDRYATASCLSCKTDREQVSVFLYAMGDVADDILTTLGVDEEQTNLKDIITAFNNYFDARKNVIVERAKFNKRIQNPGEAIDSFIQDLYRLASECGFGALKEELIRDRIVVGVTDDALSNELQAKANLTLEAAKQISRQAEARAESQVIIRGEGAVNAIHKDHSKTHFHNSTRGSHTESKFTDYRQTHRKDNFHVSSSTCGYCGYESHPKHKCPARMAECTFCKKKGHYKAVCRKRQKSIREIDEDEEEENYVLDQILHVNNVEDDSWSAEVKINGKLHTFKLDTGASVSVLSEDWANKHRISIKKTTKGLKGPGETRLTVLGSIEADLEYNNKHMTEVLYIIKGQRHSLLSRTACTTLGLVARIQNINETPQQTPNFKAEFPHLFQGLGRIDSKYKYSISLKSDAQPVCIYTPRKVAHPLVPKVKKEIDRMLKDDVISPVTEPTCWCSGIVVVPKTNDAVRICVDLTHLNKAVKREIHPMASVDESLSKLANSKVFTKLDAKSGYWQIPLSEESKKLTTFVTPFGRYHFNRLPFGINSASEVFQRTMTQILGHMEGVICHIDDIMIHAPDQATHDQRVRMVLQRLQDAGITLNEKCEFSRSSLKFLGHIIDSNGVHADPEKVEAIQQFPQPTTVTELQRFLGMANQLAKFIPNLATITAPLRSLLGKSSSWLWGTPQETSFKQVKQLLTSTEVLAHYDSGKETIIAADASNYGIGAVLLQKQQDGSRRPICFISRSLSDAEKNYAVIEKEALAATWASERLEEYILGLHYTIETDHKPLVPLLNTKDIAKMPPRVQRFRLRLMRYNYTVEHVAGKAQITADTLSRAPVSQPDTAAISLLMDATLHAEKCIEMLPASSRKIEEIKEAQQSDPETTKVIDYCKSGWPDFLPNLPLLKQYWENRHHFTVVDNLLLFDDRIVVPTALRLHMMRRLHEGHQGITKTRALASTCVWWPYMSSQIETMINTCTTCAIHRPERREPLLPSSLPDRPWSRLAMDLFELKGKTYIVIIDYFSRWIELRLLKNITSENIITQIKSVFAIHGIPDMVVSDNGPQFASWEFRTFAQEYGFTHVTSSPRYPRSNGEAERAVQTIKKMLKKAADPYDALLLYRATPLNNGYSPAELLMGRKLKTKLPILLTSLSPCTPNLPEVQRKEWEQREKQRLAYNSRHRAKEAPPLQKGDTVYVKDLNRTGSVIEKHYNPRSFIVQTDKSIIRRNRQHVVPTNRVYIPTSTMETAAGNGDRPQAPSAGQTAITATDLQSPPPSDPVPLSTSQSPPKQLNKASSSHAGMRPINTSKIVTRAGREVKKPERLDL